MNGIAEIDKCNIVILRGPGQHACPAKVVLPDGIYPLHILRTADDGGDQWPQLIGLAILDELHLVTDTICISEVINQQVVRREAATQMVRKELIRGLQGGSLGLYLKI